MTTARAKSKERGNAPAGFVMLAPLVAAVALGIMGLALALHARAVISDAAAEGARAGAVSHSLERARERTQHLVGEALGEAYAQEIDAFFETSEGVAGVVVDVRAPVPVLGLAFAGPRVLEVRAHASLE